MSDSAHVKTPAQFHIAIPVGTKVLTRADGRVGVVAFVPDRAPLEYVVRFADGNEAGFRREELTIFKHVDAWIPGTPDTAALLPFVQFRCVVGSKAYGLDQEGSDTDRRGFYLPPAHLHWSLAGVPEQLETDQEECYWELEKFIRLALKGNPNVLECFYSPMVETSTPLGRELVGMAGIFMSRHVYRTYNSYVLSQFRKLEQDLRNHHEVRWKHVMHLIRLLLSGVFLLENGFLQLNVEEYRDRLLAVRRGELPWEDVEAWRLDLHRRLDYAWRHTDLPEHPDYQRANDFLIQARLFAASTNFSLE